MFYVGQKIVCIDASGLDPAEPPIPVRGHIYTFGGICPLCDADGEPDPGIMVAELRFDGCWLRSRFRPVIARSTETGMAILRPLLNSKPAKAPVSVYIQQRKSEGSA